MTRRHLQNIVVSREPIHSASACRPVVGSNCGDRRTGHVGRNPGLGGQRLHLIAAENLMNLVGGNRRIRPVLTHEDTSPPMPLS